MDLRMLPPSGQLHVPTGDEVLSGPTVEEISSPRRWNRSPAELVADLSGGELPHGLTAPCTRIVHGTYRNSFSEALLFGYHNMHAVISRERRFDCQEIERYAARIDHHIMHDNPAEWPIPLIEKSEGRYCVDFSRCNQDTVVQIDDEVYFGTPIEPLNWGMWLLQALPSAVDYVRQGQQGRFLCYADRDWQKNILKLAGIPEDKLIEQQLLQTYDCQRIVMQQYSEIDLAPTDVDHAIYSSIADDCAARCAAAGEKIFVSRRSITQLYEGRYRALLNEEELVDALAARGFTIVEPELLPFEEQVAIFRGARTVVGLGGAGMFNVLFCAPGTRIVSIESSLAFVDGHASLFASLGHAYGFIFGQQDPTDDTFVHKRWTIDVPRAVAAIESFV
jgi:Glycosyltransferase 61